MPARLVMVGDGPLRGQVRAMVKQLGLTEDVELLGHVTWDEVRRLYESASVLLFTSLRESFGAPFLEALGKGLPAVALDLARNQRRRCRLRSSEGRTSAKAR